MRAPAAPSSALAATAALGAWAWEPNNAGADAGTSVALAGDVNGDGRDDILIGYPYGRGTDADDFRGYAWLHYGGAVVHDGTPAWFAWGRAEQDAHFGEFLAPGGDFNGEGWPDFIAASTLFDEYDPQTPWYNGGIVEVFYGNGGGVTVAPRSGSKWR